MSDADTGALLWSDGSLSPYLNSIFHIVFSRDGRYVGVHCDSGDVFRVWRVEDGECIASESTGGGARMASASFHGTESGGQERRKAEGFPHYRAVICKGRATIHAALCTSRGIFSLSNIDAPLFTPVNE